MQSTNTVYNTVQQTWQITTCTLPIAFPVGYQTLCWIWAELHSKHSHSILLNSTWCLDKFMGGF